MWIKRIDSKAAGASAEQEYRRRTRKFWRENRGALAYLCLMPVVAVASMFVFDPGPWMSFGFGVLAGVCGFAGAVALTISPPSAERWKIGAEGERSSAAQLEKLRALGWSVVHDRKLKRANVDHVLVGPGGVFAIDSKNWSAAARVKDGVVMCGDHAKPEVARHARGTAAAINSVIKSSTPRNVWVEAVIVFWGEFPQNYIHEDKVTFVAGETLTAWLYSREMVLKSDQIAEITRAIEGMPDGVELGGFG